MEITFKDIRELDEYEWIGILKRESKDYHFNKLMPTLPEEAFQRRFVGKANAEAFQASYDAIEAFKECCERLGCSFNSEQKILDFGCGWGRISQTLYRYFEPKNIFSADIQDEALDFCRDSGLATNIISTKNNFINLDEYSLDYIFAFSVFSHLSEDNANFWMNYFNKLLKPGGCIVVTTRAKSIIKYASSLKDKTDIPLQAKGLLEVFSNPTLDMENYDKGLFIYKNYKHVNKTGKGYGEALIPKQYVEKYFVPIFNGQLIFAEATKDVDQAIIAIRKGQ